MGETWRPVCLLVRTVFDTIAQSTLIQISRSDVCVKEHIGGGESSQQIDFAVFGFARASSDTIPSLPWQCGHSQACTRSISFVLFGPLSCEINALCFPFSELFSPPESHPH